MSVLEVSNLFFDYGSKELFSSAHMRLFSGEHAVLVGQNGVGKTTLFKLLDKELKPDKGSILWANNLKVGYLDQYAKIDPSITVKSYLYDVFLPLFEKEKKMEELYESISSEAISNHAKILEWASSIGEELIKENFYQIKSNVLSIISGLGLSTDILDLKIALLSGGMRSKIILGKLLLESADVLLLDEPTNFLDSKHIEWLARFLVEYPKTFFVISHNEDFLSKIANVVFSVENKQITKYKGDYSYYLKEKDLRLLQHEKAYNSQKKLIAKTEEFINKNLVRASTTKRAQSRRKMLEKLVRISKPISSQDIYFDFPFANPTGKEVLITKDLLIGYDKPLLEPINTRIMRNDKTVIVGKNGVGKSTFIKTILDVIQPIEGTHKWIDSVNIGYFKQEDDLDIEKTPFEVLSSQFVFLDKKEIMVLLSSSGINYEMANRSIKTLSGGEKTKIRLALMRYQKTNTLVFDEPTNHLDVATKKALSEAFLRYQGTLVLVSHEKDFYLDICDSIITFE